jgi:dihydropyrimidine dehydrogenase (NADP+)
MTTHTELVRLQKEAIEEKKKAKVGLGNDDAWSGDDFVRQSDSMVSN